MPATALALILYALVVLASGIFNRVVNGGEKGLWFGLAMGAVAVAGALSMTRGQEKLGRGLGWFALCTVGGWFLYETFARQGGVPTVRMALVILASAAMAAALARPRRADAGEAADGGGLASGAGR